MPTVWLYNQKSGVIQKESGVAGFIDHYFGTNLGPLGKQIVIGQWAGWFAFPTQADAQAFKVTHPSLVPNPRGSITGALTGGLQLPQLQGLRQFMVRLAEGILGLALILVGLAHLTRDTPAGQVLNRGLAKVALA
jgi:hypothetical protein